MDEKQKLVKAYGEVTGRLPINLNDILNILKHPDVIVHAKAYLQLHDHTDACQKFQAPWNCIREQEAYTQTIGDIWAGRLDELMEDWCVNCRARLFGDETGGPIPMDNNWLEDVSDEKVDNPYLADCD